jgi:hypothetical protein
LAMMPKSIKNPSKFADFTTRPSRPNPTTLAALAAFGVRAAIPDAVAFAAPGETIAGLGVGGAGAGCLPGERRQEPGVPMGGQRSAFSDQQTAIGCRQDACVTGGASFFYCRRDACVTGDAGKMPALRAAQILLMQARCLRYGLPNSFYCRRDACVTGRPSFFCCRRDACATGWRGRRRSRSAVNSW